MAEPFILPSGVHAGLVIEGNDVNGLGLKQTLEPLRSLRSGTSLLDDGGLLNEVQLREALQ